jgi:transposase
MLLSDQDLRQIDEEYVESLDIDDLREFTKRVVADLKETRDRLNQNSTNSSRPPSSEAPWVRAKFEETEEDSEFAEDTIEKDECDAEEEDDDEPDVSDSEEEKEPSKKDTDSKPTRKPGKQKGAKGCGRTEYPPVTGIVIHKAQECAACGGGTLDEESEFVARYGHYEIDIEVGNDKEPGIRVKNTKHIYGDTTCSCGHVSQTKPHRCEKESDWSVELTEWHLVGPMLMSFICFLFCRMKMSRPRIRELLIEWLHLPLSVGTINQCIHESGRAGAPVVDQQIIEEVKNSGLLNIDETSWKQAGKPLWLWVFSTKEGALYIIGDRSRKIIENVLGLVFAGWIMSDGYKVYRSYKKRLRCWAHLLRKARGLHQSLDKEAQLFGEQVLDILNTLMEAIYRAREIPGENLVEKYKELLDELKTLCEKYQESEHEKTSALAKEFLNDWDAIFCVLAHPELPLTNNEAERALRHWVILRKICYGTRTQQGSRAFVVLASIIDTCRKRNISPWHYLARVISERRKGNDAPLIPAASL